MQAVERKVTIVPASAIGPIRLGMHRADLPQGALIQMPGGTYEGIHFLLSEREEVEDIWIDDIKTFPATLELNGRTFPRSASIEGLEAIVGKCDRLQGRKGGVFFNCATGVALGRDFSGSTIQVRVKHL